MLCNKGEWKSQVEDYIGLLLRKESEGIPASDFQCWDEHMVDDDPSDLRSPSWFFLGRGVHLLRLNFNGNLGKGKHDGRNWGCTHLGVISHSFSRFKT